MGKVRIQGETREINTSASKLGKGSASFFLGFNRYKLAEREYIILYKQNYDLFLRTYANSFVSAMQSDVSLDFANGINVYSQRVKALSKSISSSAKSETADLIDSTVDMIKFEQEFADLFVQGAADGLFQGINANEQARKTARQALANSLPTENSTIYSNNAQLDKFFSIYWYMLDGITKSRDATAAFKTILKEWRKTGVASYSGIMLNQSDMAALASVIEMLNKISTAYNSLVGTVKNYKTKGSVVRTAHMASNDIIGMLQSVLSNVGGNMGQEAAAKMVDRVVQVNVPQELKAISQNLSHRSVQNGFTIAASSEQFTQVIGASKQGENSTVKTDVSSSWLKATMNQGSTSTSFLAKVNINVKSYPSLSGMTVNDVVDYGKSSAKMVKIQEKTGIYEYLKAFSPDTARFYAENTMVHAGDSSAQMRLVKNGIASKFFVDWLAGTGNRIGETDEIDVSNFMMINGRIFSMYDVLQEVVKSFNQDTMSSAINVSISGRKRLTDINKKLNPRTNSYAEGFKRSKSVIGAMKDLQLIARMNPKVFFQIAASKNIKSFTL